MTEGIRFRCPKCEKLYKYTYQGTDQSTYSGRIPFLCRHCHSKFAVEKSFTHTKEAPAVLIDESVASISNKKESIGTFPCPKCSHENENGSLECLKCGVVFQKFEEKILNSEVIKVEGSKILKEAWKHVLENYENMKVHEEFVQLALEDENLPFASSQYRKILNVHPADSIAQKMMDRMTSLAMANLIPSQMAMEYSIKKLPKVPMVLIGVAVTLIIMGLLLPPLSQAISAGVAMLVLSIGVWVVLNKRTSY